jgi:hypothetical protein
VEAKVQELREILKTVKRVIIADSKPVTMSAIASLKTELLESEGLRVLSPNPRRVETSIPELKGKVEVPGPEKTVVFQEHNLHVSCPAELKDMTPQLVLGTAEPDPMFGIIDARISFCLSLFENFHRLAYLRRGSDEPGVFAESPSYGVADTVLEKVKAEFVTFVPLAGTMREAISGSSFREEKAAFYSTSLPATRGAIIGAGGSSYDDTLSHVLRLVWSSTNAVRKGGRLLIVGECTEGLGSKMLNLLATGRASDEKARQTYSDGIEELAYLTKLKDDYEVVLLSSLPELYAKTRLGIKIVRSAAEGAAKLLEGLGRTAKMNIVPRACESLLAEA